MSEANVIPKHSTQSTLQRVKLPTPVIFDDYYTSFMWIVDQIRCLRVLIVRSIRRLLNVLSVTAPETRLEVASLLHKYHCLLFQDAPTRAHKAMVGFSRWLADVLAGTNSEGVEDVPTHSEKAWLDLKEQHFNNLAGQGALAFDKATTIQLLKTACEYYMARCDRLQKANSGLVSQLADLKTQLQRSLVSTYLSQHALEREREVSALQARHLVTAVQTRDHLLLPQSRCEHPGRLCPQTVFDMAGTVSLAPQDVNEQASATYEPSISSAEYKQLTELCSSGEGHGRWYSRALRTLMKARRQKKLRKVQACAAATRPVNMFTASTVCKETNTKEFTKLVSSRDPVGDDEDKTWYRRTLVHLTNERQRRLRHRYRADSFFSTTSIVD